MSGAVARDAPSRGAALSEWILVALVGAASAGLAIAVGEMRSSILLAGLAAAVGAAVVLANGWIKPTLLAACVALQTLNRQYYSFDWLHGDLGGRGLYWTPADLTLIGLLLHWAWERVRGVRFVAQSPGLAIWIAPLAGVAILSAIGSKEPVGSLVESLRYVKIAVLLVYLRFNLDRRSTLTMVAALAGVCVAQSGVAVLQVAFASGQNGLTEIFRTSEPSELARRASGTLGHPNFLAPYMLFVAPPFVAVALGLWRWPAAKAAAVAAAAGSLTVVLTQSRSPILLLGVGLFALLALLLARRAITPLRAAGVVTALGVLLVAAVVPLAGVIEKRLTGDFGRSVDFRANYNEAALRMWGANPFLGVGPNNFGQEIRHFAPDHYVILQLDELESEASRSKVHLRAVAPVHNVYLLVGSEMGAFGFAAFVVYLLRILTLAWRGARAAPAPQALFAAGVFCGLLAECLQQLVDYSLLWDPLLTTFALVGALCDRFDPKAAPL